MHEFNNRIQAQRHVLQIVNSRAWKEELCGMSSKAIDRWASANKIEARCRLVILLRTVADELFFLANKSQEQITDEYRDRSRRVASLGADIEVELAQATGLPCVSTQDEDAKTDLRSLK